MFPVMGVQDQKAKGIIETTYLQIGDEEEFLQPDGDKSEEIIATDNG